jgi:hypothetical protein
VRTKAKKIGGDAVIVQSHGTNTEPGGAISTGTITPVGSGAMMTGSTVFIRHHTDRATVGIAKGLWGCYPQQERSGAPCPGCWKPWQDKKISPGDRREEMKKRKNDTSQGGESPSRLIDGRIKELGDWRGETLSRIRSLIKQADPGVTEEWKWRGVPVWSHDGLICTGETYKNVVKLTFAKGAQLRDPSKLFNSSLEGNVRRAIDLHEGDKVDDSAFKALIRDAVALNTSARRG